MDQTRQLEERLRALALSTPWFERALRAAARLELDAWCIGAGAVRNLVWDHLQGAAAPSSLADVDLAYFDAAEGDAGRDATLQARLQLAHPDVTWEVCNQATVHHWFEAHFGHPVAPLASLEEAVASWPEFATAVGVTLDPGEHCRIIAPYGLDDLFGMIVRRNPARVSLATYRERVRQKRYAARWPRVTIIGDDGT